MASSDWPARVAALLQQTTRIPQAQRGACKTLTAYGPPDLALDFQGRFGLASESPEGGSARARDLAQKEGDISLLLSSLQLLNRPEILKMVEAAMAVRL
ncbi:hypothetical protein [Acidithiobacillus thiooxidans]|jgi:hypothetical protein|uniref:hypothetical protein n=1 Tax=Acidithiobacillus thiooxidans TaxID=930 RepID=UPI001C06B4E8|nr:hypothetical protein [Acidithiobacillus thiooxidans]MBU2844190.1 hypothetical protein [Acidithiobacillus thiooxidans]